MVMIHIKRRENLDFGYELFVAAVSILSVVNMLLVYVPGVDVDAVNVVYIINTVLTLLFIFDFVLRFATAPDRTHYFVRDYGWADLLAIFPQLRILRLFRIWKAYRIIHKYGLRYILSYLSKNRSEAAVYLLVLMVIVIIELGAFLVLVAEQSSPDANIKTALDAIWWTYVTITTVGYGDRYPVTTAGRLVGILVLTTGVAVFATFAGYISSKLLGTTDEEDEEETPGKGPAAEAKGTSWQLAEVRRLMAERERLDAAIAARISDLEGVLRQPAEETLDRQ